MATFILTLDWTDQGIRNLKEAPKRSEAAKALAKKVGVEIKEVYLTTGAHDLLLLAEAPLGDHITKFALAVGSLGNVRTSTSRAWPEAEWTKLISELPQRRRICDGPRVPPARGPSRHLTAAQQWGRFQSEADSCSAKKQATHQRSAAGRQHRSRRQQC